MFSAGNLCPSEEDNIPPRFVPYKEKRPREYLVPHEVEELIAYKIDMEK